MTTINKNHQIGGLYFESSQSEKLEFPLKHTAVKAKINGNLSRVEVSQSFENSFDKPLEAVYVFPLPDEAAVDEMEIKIGSSIIKGNIKKREEAVAIYEQAKKQGRTAGLLEQERDNIFTQSLANIKPGEQIDVTIRYSDSLKFVGGDYEFVFPMVVGPRYIPGTPIDDNGDTDTVPDASRITPPIIPQGMRSGHDISLVLEIDAGLPVSKVDSPSHQLEIEEIEENQIIRIKLAEEDNIPNKDFILRYQVSTEATQSTVITQTDNRGGHFAVYLIPALQYQTDDIIPKDVVFLVDTSGSQSGPPLQQCKELMRRFINGLNPKDTFSILDFSFQVRRLSKTPLANTPENRSQAINYINNLTAGGGTEMLGGIQAAINFPAPKGRLRTVVLLSDGYIGNENQILAEVQQNLQLGNRLFSFGAGSSVNRFLLNRIAEVGRGISTIIRDDEPTQEVVEKFFQQINNPVLSNIEITWDGVGETPVIYPVLAPDLFAEQPLVLFGRKQDNISGLLSIKGVAAGGEDYENIFEINFESATENPAVAQLWGRARIKDLMNQMFGYETKTGVEEVTETALTYQLLSQYTAFIAVSDDQRLNPLDSISMEIPVEMSGATDFMEVEKERGISVGGGMLQIARSISPGGQSVLAKSSNSRARTSQSVKRKRDISKTSSNRCLEIVKVTGLDETAISDLQEYLQHFYLRVELKGEIVFEFSIKRNRVRSLVLDEKKSTNIPLALINKLIPFLQAWKSPQKVAKQVVLTLRSR